MSPHYEVRVAGGGRQITLEGALRPADHRALTDVRTAIDQAAAAGTEELCLDMKRVTQMNQVAFSELSRGIKLAVERSPKRPVRLVVSSVIPWAIRRFQTLASVFSNVVVDVYDRAMYPSQELLEDESFAEVLRAQDEIVWNQERRILPRHGLKEKMRVADVCCGVGGFPTWLSKAFKPEQLVAIDHSKSSLRAAQAYARQQETSEIEFAYGEATALLLPDASFDFVSCRLALQVSPAQEQMARELVRVCKPGGRVYVTNEMLSSATGYPQEETIRSGYEAAVHVAAKGGMDMNLGIRAGGLLRAAGLEDIRYDLLIVDTTNTERAKLARVFETWGRFFDDLCDILNAPPEVRDAYKRGLAAHAAAARSPEGYAMWPIVAVSGKRPSRGA